MKLTSLLQLVDKLQQARTCNKSVAFLAVNTRKNAQIVTSLQTSCNKSVHKLLTSCIRTACSWFVVTSLEQVVNNL